MDSGQASRTTDPTAPPSRVDRRLLSIVIPLYDEEDLLATLLARLDSVIPTLGFDAVEVLLVSDGSRDRTEELVAAHCRRNPDYRGIFLARNFGHQAAIWTGIEQATGSVVAVMDGDLQDPPEVLPRMLEALEEGADVAYGVRSKRSEPIWKRFCYKLFYRILRRVASIDIPLDTGDFCCMKERVAEAMRSLPERTRFVRGLRAWVGYRQVGIPYERGERAAGSPGYSLSKLIGLAYDGIFSFSDLPVRLIQLLGFVASAFAVAVAGYYTIWFFVQRDRFPSGFATITVSLWLLAGLQLFFLGIVGEYVVRGVRESRARPVAVIREIVTSASGDEAAGERRSGPRTDDDPPGEPGV